MLFAAVSFFDGDVKISRAAGRIHIIDFKCTRSNVALVDDVAILADHDLRVGARNATNDGGIAFL